MTATVVVVTTTQRPDADEPPDGSRGSGLAAAGELVCTRSAQKNLP
eukprot:COSAG06_NODE_185_length_20838_cov_50.259463_5_plen_46_part_00